MRRRVSEAVLPALLVIGGLVTGSGAKAEDIYARILAVAPLSVAEARPGATLPDADIVLSSEPGEGRVFLDVDESALAAHPGIALTAALFNNYALPEEAYETETEAEEAEIDALLDHLITTPEIEIVRDHVAARSDRVLSEAEMRTLIRGVWFSPFSQGDDPDLTGFEHVFIGEAEGEKAQGLHYWHRYLHLEEAGEVDAYRDRRKRDEKGTRNVTIAFDWDAEDPETGEIFRLTKPIGGFIAGARPAALIAIGLVRALGGPAETVMDGERFEVVLHRAPDGRRIRTLYFAHKS